MSKKFVEKGTITGSVLASGIGGYYNVSNSMFEGKLKGNSATTVLAGIFANNSTSALNITISNCAAIVDATESTAPVQLFVNLPATSTANISSTYGLLTTTAGQQKSYILGAAETESTAFADENWLSPSLNMTYAMPRALLWAGLNLQNSGSVLDWLKAEGYGLAA